MRACFVLTLQWASYESSINKPPASIDPPTYLTFPALLQCVLLLSVFHHAAEIPPSGLFSLPWYSVSINFQGLFQPSPIPAKDDAIGILLHMQLLPFRFYLFTADPRRSACLSVCLSINDLENHDGQAQYKLAPQLSISTHRRMKVAVDLEIRGRYHRCTEDPDDTGIQGCSDRSSSHSTCLCIDCSSHARHLRPSVPRKFLVRRLSGMQSSYLSTIIARQTRSSGALGPTFVQPPTCKSSIFRGLRTEKAKRNAFRDNSLDMFFNLVYRFALLSYDAIVL